MHPVRKFTPILLLLAACGPRAPAPSEAELLQAAKEVAVWATPTVSVDAMRDGFLRDGGARYGDFLYWSKPGDALLQITTPNASAHYVLFSFSLKDGPVVLEMPPAVGAGLFGSLLDAWQVPLADVGPAGDDSGKGGKYLLLPPGYAGEVPAGYFPVRFATNNGYSALRAIPEGTDAEAVPRAIALIRKLRMYPLAAAVAPPESRFIDMSGKRYDGIVKFDDTFFDRLAKMVEEDPSYPSDSAFVGRMRLIGIEKGRPFAPDSMRRALLRRAAEEVHAHFQKISTEATDLYWSGTHWGLPQSNAGPTGFTFIQDGKLDVEGRGLFYFLACAPPKQLGKATLYLATYFDGSGAELLGDSTYHFRVPAHPPAAQFWALTVYDRGTAAFIAGAPTVEINSYSRTMKRNSDGTVDIYFGPRPPVGKEGNWIATVPGRKWFAFFRFYGPQPAILDRSWRMGDIERG